MKSKDLGKNLGESSTKDDFAGNWKIMKGKVKEKWGELTDDDLDQISGKRDQLLGAIQKRYGYEKAQAEKELRNWEVTMEEKHTVRPRK